MWKTLIWPSAMNWCWFEEWDVEVKLRLSPSEPLVTPESIFKRHNSIFIPSIVSWSDAEFFILFMKSCKFVEWLEIHMSSKRLRLVMDILNMNHEPSKPWWQRAWLKQTIQKQPTCYCKILYILSKKTHWCCIYLYMICISKWTEWCVDETYVHLI